MRRRYASKVAGLRDIFSEFGLIKRRVLVEIRWLQQLAAIPEVAEVPPFSGEANQLLNSLAESFSVEDALEVKQVCTANCITHHHHALTCFSSLCDDSNACTCFLGFRTHFSESVLLV